MLLRVKMACPEEELPLRLPLTRPMYDCGTVTDTWPLLERDTSLLSLGIVGELGSFSPQVTIVVIVALPEKLQMKFTEDPTNPVTVFPPYGDMNCTWLAAGGSNEDKASKI